MNATPAFKGLEGEFTHDVPKGTKVVAIWGTMFPDEYGEVVSSGWSEHKIRWEDGQESWHCIRATRSVNGSPIGVWLA
jgi:hypothetical protein